MNEWTLQLLAALRILWVTIFAYLYGVGGINNKATRRYLGTLWLTLGFITFSLIDGSFSWFYLLCYPLLVGATSLGYGAETTAGKIFKRSYCGLAYAFAALPIAFVTGNWVVYALHTMMCLVFSIVLGTVNPVHARKEETLMGLTIGLLPMFLI